MQPLAAMLLHLLFRNDKSGWAILRSALMTQTYSDVLHTSPCWFAQLSRPWRPPATAAMQSDASMQSYASMEPATSGDQATDEEVNAPVGDEYPIGR